MTVNQLVLTNDVNSVIQFSGGPLNSSDTLVTNNQAFVVGDGTDAASFELAPGGLGFHQFGNGLVITNHLGHVVTRFLFGTITTSNDLVLSGATINYDLGINGGNPTGDLSAVNGNLILGGTLNITDAGGFSNATYTLFTYTGTLTYNGVSIGTTPNPSLTYRIDTNVSGQVNLDVAFTAPAGPITGTSPVSAGQTNVSYSISSVSGATTYTWTVPAGANVASGQGTTSITVNYGCAAVSDNVTVTPANANGCNGMPSSLAVTVTGVDAAGAISGLSTLCAGSNGVAYSISSVNGATTYTWTAPAGASIAGGQGSTSIAVNWGSTSGPVAVTPANANGCSGTAATLPVTVNPLPTVFNVTGGGSYCAAGSPVVVGLDGSQSGVNYQLLLNGNPTGSPVAGTGAGLSLGNQTVAGSYTVVAVDATAGCTATMAGGATVTLMDPFACWELRYFGCTNCPQADAAADPDGDGQNNMAEFLAGTIPTNSASALRITSLVRSGTDIAVTWSTAGGHTNILQAANGGANGGYNTNNFVDIAASQTIVGGSGDTTTNYLDSSGATNTPSCFYRIRLMP